MNWISKFIKPKIKSLFKKRSSKIKENLWTTCECKNLIYKEDLLSNLKCCPKCGAHHKLSCEERFQTFFDNKEYELIKSRSSLYLNSSVNLEILNSICALLDIFPEREECEEIYLLANELFNNLNDILICLDKNQNSQILSFLSNKKV